MTPDHERKGYGRIWIGEVIYFYLDEDPSRIRNRMNSYSRYTGKKFKTWVYGDTMFVERIR